MSVTWLLQHGGEVGDSLGKSVSLRTELHLPHRQTCTDHSRLCKSQHVTSAVPSSVSALSRPACNAIQLQPRLMGAESADDSSSEPASLAMPLPSCHAGHDSQRLAGRCSLWASSTIETRQQPRSRRRRCWRSLVLLQENDINFSAQITN